MGWEGPMTHRQFEAWQEWYPIRDRVVTSEPATPLPEGWPGLPGEPPKRMTRESILEAQKAERRFQVDQANKPKAPGLRPNQRRAGS